VSIFVISFEELVVDDSFFIDADECEGYFVETMRSEVPTWL